MTHYPGGKKRIGEEIAGEIYYRSLEYEDKTNIKLRGYCEPFCGMLGVYQHVPALFEEGTDGEGPLKASHSKLKYLAGDRDPTIVCMWNAAQRGWKPPRSCTESKFYRLKKTKDKVTPEKAFLGRAAAYKNTYFTTYSDFNNVSIQADHVKEIGEELYDAKFTNGEYTQFSRLKDFVIYCDPPYRNTVCKYYDKELRQNSEFDYEYFYDWCRKMRENNIVFISEYNMPKKKFTTVWSHKKENLYVVNY